MPSLTTPQRYQIEHDIRLGLSNAAIATGLGCSTRTVEREVSRCDGRQRYTHKQALAHRHQCAQNSAANHPTIAAEIWQTIEARLTKKHSPEQIIHSLGIDISISSIYRYLRRMGKVSLLKQLRHYGASQKRNGKAGKMKWVKKAQTYKRRPKAVRTRDKMGHLECDSIVGKRNEHDKLVVLLDRATRFVRLALVSDGTAASVALKMAQWQKDKTGIPILSLTTDQGIEFSALPALLPDRLYACDPGKPYQKGAVENMNKLIRQYISKGSSLRHLTQAKLNWIANQLNQRPRKRLGWKTPDTMRLNMISAPTS